MRTISPVGPLALLILLTGSLALPAAEPSASTDAARIELKRDDNQGTLQVLLGGREAFVYQYGHVDMPHLYPVQSPSGKLLTIQKTDPYPHHRSVWFGDTVQLEGQPPVSFYQPLYSQVDKKDPQSAYRDRIRHVKFLAEEVKDGQANLEMQLLWEANLGQVPVMDDVRQMRVVSAGQRRVLPGLQVHGDRRLRRRDLPQRPGALCLALRADASAIRGRADANRKGRR